MKLKNVIVWTGLCILLCGWLLGCTAVSTEPTEPHPKLTILAAASLTEAFTEMGQAFAEAQGNDVDLAFSFAGSSRLAAQLQEGAVADIFASANETQMETAVSANRIQSDTIQTFATNQLTLIVPADNPANITGLADLANPNVRLLLATPGVPVRDYTDALIQTLDADFQARFYANLVSEGQNVRQVVAQIGLGEADAGIVYRSDVMSDRAQTLQQIPLPDAQNIVAHYPIGLATDAPQPELAQQFIAFVLSPEGQEILARWGFGPAPVQ